MKNVRNRCLYQIRVGGGFRRRNREHKLGICRRKIIIMITGIIAGVKISNSTLA